MSEQSRAATILGVTLGLGVALAGFLTGRGFLEGRSQDRYVTVRGLSERVLPADLVVWPLVFSASGNHLSEIQERLDKNAEQILVFLEARGFAREEVTRSVPRVEERSVHSGSGPRERYSVEVTMALRTSDVEKVRQAMADAGEMVGQGVALRQSYNEQTEFFFTDLESVKPDMIAEATRDARRAAMQFAEDSGSRVGSIRNAKQGYFSVSPRDKFSPHYKKVRVVTTVEFFLED